MKNFFDSLLHCNLFFNSRKSNQHRELFKTLFEEFSPMCIVDDDGVIVNANKAMADTFMYSTHRQLTNTPFYNVIDSSNIDNITNITEKIRTRQLNHTYFEGKFTTNADTPIDCIVIVSRVSDYDFFVVQFIDITDRKQAEKTITKLAYYDSLTGLPNRTYFNQYSSHLLQQIANTQQRCAILLIDLDNFKHYNDTRGHEFGDYVLQHVASKLQQTINTLCEDVECLCCRLGGDEFVIICSNVNNGNTIEQMAQKCLSIFDQSFIIANQQVDLSASIGVSLYPNDGTDVSTLLKSADLALYQSKRFGKNQFCFHDVTQVTEMEQYIESEKALRYFIDTEDFVLAYQLVLDTFSYTFQSAEALFRGNNNRYKNINLGQMFDAAEQSGLIVPLGERIFEQACKDCAYIRKTANPYFKISVNISIKQLIQENFIEMVTSTADRYDLPYQALDLEITETNLIEDFERCRSKLSDLKKLGFHISLDDFGKGYSSMTYIRRLPITRLKIDKDFIDDINGNSDQTDNKAEQIIKGIIHLSKVLKIKSCMEGIETKKQFDTIFETNVDQVQGFYFHHPSTVGDVIHQLSDNENNEETEYG